MKNLFKEFEAFISKGNVLDLAVAVIIVLAFNAIVTSLVKDIINPLIGFIIGKPDFTDLFIVLKRPVDYTGAHTYDALVKARATVFGYGAFLTAVVHFLLLALVIFFLMKVVKNLRDKLEKEEGVKEDPAPAPTPEDVLLLREIRDLLKANPQVAAAAAKPLTMSASESASAKTLLEENANTESAESAKSAL